MATPNSNYTEIITTTIENRQKALADNVSGNNALLSRLKQRGNQRFFSGGHKIIQELDHTENSTYTRYSGLDTINVGASEVISASEWEIKQAAVSVVVSGLEMVQNAGKEKMLDLLEARVTNAERTFANNMSADIYSDGTASNQVDGLQKIVDPDPTSSATVGNIAQDTFTFWQNIAKRASLAMKNWMNCWKIPRDNQQLSRTYGNGVRKVQRLGSELNNNLPTSVQHLAVMI